MINLIIVISHQWGGGGSCWNKENDCQPVLVISPNLLYTYQLYFSLQSFRKSNGRKNNLIGSFSLLFLLFYLPPETDLDWNCNWNVSCAAIVVHTYLVLRLSFIWVILWRQSKDKRQISCSRKNENTSQNVLSQTIKILPSDPG